MGDFIWYEHIAIKHIDIKHITIKHVAIKHIAIKTYARTSIDYIGESAIGSAATTPDLQATEGQPWNWHISFCGAQRRLCPRPRDLIGC